MPLEGALASTTRYLINTPSVGFLLHGSPSVNNCPDKHVPSLTRTERSQRGSRRVVVEEQQEGRRKGAEDTGGRRQMADMSGTVTQFIPQTVRVQAATTTADRPLITG